MSRHRRVRNMSYGEGKLIDVFVEAPFTVGVCFCVDDDYYEYGRSLEEDAPLSPNTAGIFAVASSENRLVI